MSTPTHEATSEESARAEHLLAEHRAAIDRLDAVLVFALAERFAHTRAVGQLKAQHALPPSDPAREAWQAARLDRLSQDAGLDPAFARQMLEFIIAEVIRQHQQHQKT
ncbi:MAG: chorismate mutase [Rhodobacteraceae bacterium]|nr:chorismate mutase [Paracoccaceae bacterium]